MAEVDGVLTNGVHIRVPLFTTSIDTGDQDIRTTGDLYADSVIASSGIAAPSVTVTGYVQTPVLRSSTNVITIGDENDFTLARPVSSGAGGALTIQGQSATNAFGGDLVLKPGSGQHYCFDINGAAVAGATEETCTSSCVATHVEACGLIALAADCGNDNRCAFNDQSTADTADDVCEAAHLVQCAAESANGATACTAAGDCSHTLRTRRTGHGRTLRAPGT
jgi:hypothetical protein